MRRPVITGKDRPEITISKRIRSLVEDQPSAVSWRQMGWGESGGMGRKAEGPGKRNLMSGDQADNRFATRAAKWNAFSMGRSECEL
jgi:hypothetical protein